MRIGELARATGVDVETIRFYERSGVLQAPPRQENGYRAYGTPHLQRLAFVRHCRALDLPLDAVAQLLQLTSQERVDCAGVDHVVDEQIERVRERIAGLQALEQRLLELRAACASPRDGRCGIAGELVAAAQGAPCACHAPAHKEPAGG